MEWFSGWTGWLIFGFVLLMLELVIPGVFVMWWGFAAILVAGLVAILPLSFGIQAILFAILATIFSLIWWKYQHCKDYQEDQHGDLNSCDHAMIGTTGVVVDILENGIARGKFGDTTWRVVGENLKINDIVKVIKVEGITLYVASPH